MFRQLFSKKNDVKEEMAVINAAFDAYRSDIFPCGISAVALNINTSRNIKGIRVEITLPFVVRNEFYALATSLSEALETTVRIICLFDVNSVRVHNIENVANIIAIASGKGGVGKSTSVVNIARALQAEGAKVGILDADIYGPSIPTMLGQADEKPTSSDGKLMQPINADGVISMSIGYLVPDCDAAVWRGPMASTAFEQLLNETNWPKLDYLLVDMPPGTGDIQLTLSQKVPVAAAVVVTTPQDIALVDAQKGIAMFDKVKVPVLGVIENMSYHICENCGHHAHLFGIDGGKDIAEKNNVDLLGQLPLHIGVRQNADLGINIFKDTPDSDICVQYHKIASNIASKLYYSLDITSPNQPNVVMK